METFLKILHDIFSGWGDVWPRPAYDTHPRELKMNQEPTFVESVPALPIQPKIYGKEIVVKAALAALDKDVTPDDQVPDEVACVAQLVATLKDTTYALPRTLTFTPVLFNILRSDKRWRATLVPSSGSIIISPTIGQTIGHCGIFLSSRRIASNTSATGKWEDNYSFPNWVDYFKTKRGLHIYIFEPVDN